MKYLFYSSTGNTLGLEEYIAYLELDNTGHCVRYLELKSEDSILRYSTSHAADRHGQLPEGVWNSGDVLDSAYGVQGLLPRGVFEALWTRLRCDNDPIVGV